jgi:hypothetical protein
VLLRRLAFICIALLFVGAARAQDDAATSLPISYGQEVTDTISDVAFFDHWQINAKAGDRLYIRMGAADGLQPLIGILNAGGTLLARSSEGNANDAINLTFDVTQDGLYIIVATRAGNQSGSSAGSYTLFVDNLAAAPTRDPIYQDVTFLCNDSDALAVATIHFAREDTDNGAYPIRVYGFAPFQPAIRVQSGSSDVCITRQAAAFGDVLTLPGERPITLTDAELPYTAEYLLTGENTPDPSSITITIGSYGQMPGRYLVLIGGFAIEPSSDEDVLDLRLAPFPGNNGRAPMLVYAVGVNNRLDPSVITGDNTRCDDAGRRGCDDVPSFDGAGVILNNGVRITGDRFDAGVRIADTQPHPLRIVSFSGTTRGEYALILTGELPPTD